MKVIQRGWRTINIHFRLESFEHFFVCYEVSVTHVIYVKGRGQGPIFNTRPTQDRYYETRQPQARYSIQDHPRMDIMRQGNPGPDISIQDHPRTDIMRKGNPGPDISIQDHQG